MDEILPIFPLGLVLLPGEPEQLRIFEPRYKQMLDDCVLDDRPFGICLMDEASDLPEEILKGWSAPSLSSRMGYMVTSPRSVIDSGWTRTSSNGGSRSA